MSHFSFKRPELAMAYCDSLEGKGIANARSGLFLAAPRRVGKSTFVLDELIPEAENRGWMTVYVDLWADKNANPAILIAEAIKAKMSLFENKLLKLAKAVKLSKLQLLGTLIIDFTQPGLPPNITLPDAIRFLADISEKPVMLVIDEAQHALMTDNGVNAMFALKSARDQLNTNTQHPTLMLVFTGSNQNKLAHLLLKKGQPFFGSDINAFPLLNKQYTDAFTQWVNKNLKEDNQFTQDSIWHAFELLGNRPEILRNIVGKIAIAGDAKHFDGLLKKDALILQNQIWHEFENEYLALNPLQQAILNTLINKGRDWSPFSEESMQNYKKLTQQKTLSTASVQTAIDQLREKDFIWQSGRGSYALEDESFAQWFIHRY
ncbi:MAG: ATP-binding protein [Legionellales bacterium]|nr:ATP-binding protein [Legionellales bacterium]